MHPNWRALATLHIPLKRFVTAGASEEPSTSLYQEKYQISNVRSSEVKEFYHEVITTPETAPKHEPPQVHSNTRVELKKIPFDRNKFFRAAMANDTSNILLFNYQDGDINTTDAYGWTALMMAACEGAADAAETLMELGADINYKDRSGNTAFKLAEKKNFFNILELFLERGVDATGSETEEQDDDSVHSEFFCDVCRRSFQETSLRDHVTSTVHQFNKKQNKKSSLNRFNIPAKNRGLKIMLKQGWDEESGLGPSNSGRLFPVKTVIRKQRTGLGTQQEPARVTHFQAYDLRAIKYVPRPKTKNRNDMRHEKQREWKRERRLRKELS